MWINSEEQLPKADQQILFMVSETEMRKGVFLEKDQFDRFNMFCDGAFFHKSKVKFWMPLPSPPKDLKEGDKG